LKEFEEFEGDVGVGYYSKEDRSLLLIMNCLTSLAFCNLKIGFQEALGEVL
jgi:hypothetical protein